MAWYEEFFGEDYMRFHLCGGSDVEVRAPGECDFVVSALELQSGARILDLCCGQGRHSVELARRSFRVTGFDLSEYLLGVAKRKAAEMGVEVEFVRADMREIPWENEFDAVVSLFTSFGYLETDEEDERVLRSVRQVLRPGGGLMIDQPNRERTTPWLGSGRQHWAEHDGHIILEDHAWDVLRSRITMTRTIIAPDGSRRQTGFVLRIYSHSEWLGMLRRAGLVWVRTYGNYDGSDYSCDSRGTIIIARRPEERVQ
jgi:SAM-dependent methyltransferase